MIDSELLALLCCPETRQALRVADAELIGQVNQKISSGSLSNKGAQPVKEVLEAALITEDGKILYPIRQGIPVMLVEESISLS